MPYPFLSISSSKFGEPQTQTRFLNPFFFLFPIDYKFDIHVLHVQWFIVVVLLKPRRKPRYLRRQYSIG